METGVILQQRELHAANSKPDPAKVARLLPKGNPTHVDKLLITPHRNFVFLARAQFVAFESLTADVQPTSVMCTLYNHTLGELLGR